MREIFIATLYIGPFILVPLALIYFSEDYNNLVIYQFCNGDFQNCYFENENQRTDSKIVYYLAIVNIILFGITFSTSKLKANQIEEKIIKISLVSILYIISIASCFVTYFYFLNLTAITL